MKTANFGRNYKVLGSLQGVAAFALVTVLALSGSAYAQVVLGDVTVEADATYTPGENVNVTITIDRSDAPQVDPDDDVTALGGELTLPAGWTLALDADNDCTPVLQSGETALDNQVQNVNARVQFKRNQALFTDPPTNSVCTPVPDTGVLLEFFWLDAQANNPLPVNFPVVLKLVLTAAANSTGVQNLDLEAKYRVDTGQEQTTNAPTVEIDEDVVVGGCQTVLGDANSSGTVTTADAQLVFGAALRRPASLAAINFACGKLCTAGNGNDTAVTTGDAQGVFRRALNRPNPCGK